MLMFSWAGQGVTPASSLRSLASRGLAVPRRRQLGRSQHNGECKTILCRYETQLFAASFEEKVDFTAKYSCLLPRSCAAAAGGAGCFLASCAPPPPAAAPCLDSGHCGHRTMTLYKVHHITHRTWHATREWGQEVIIASSPCNCTAPSSGLHHHSPSSSRNPLHRITATRGPLTTGQNIYLVDIYCRIST